MATIADLQPLPDGYPVWIAPSLPKAGRDPLGLQTITEDRITPILLPGVLALSRRARYFSYYPFLLDQYRLAEGRASNSALDVYIKRREFEFAVAARLCSKCAVEGTGANAAEQARAALREAGDGPIDRRESVESTLGGYGLYYKSPLVDLGVVAPQGTQSLPSTQIVKREALTHSPEFEPVAVSRRGVGPRRGSGRFRAPDPGGRGRGTDHRRVEEQDQRRVGGRAGGPFLGARR